MKKEYRFFWRGEAECLPVLLELLWLQMQETSEL